MIIKTRINPEFQPKWKRLKEELKLVDNAGIDLHGAESKAIRTAIELALEYIDKNAQLRDKVGLEFVSHKLNLP